METRRTVPYLWAIILCGIVLCCLTLTGCIETSVQTRLETDGSGTRRVEMVWRQGTLDDLELTQEDVRTLLGLSDERGWTTRTENRPVRDGSSEAHVVFERTVEVSSISDWPSLASDFRFRATADQLADVRNLASVEIGRGAGYRTIRYHELIDGTDVLELLNRMAADFIVDGIAARDARLGETPLAAIRGLFIGHLSHFAVFVLEDEDADAAWEDLIDEIAPQLALLLADRDASPESTQSVKTMIHEIVADEAVNDKLDESLPGLSLLAFMNLKLEISMPGTVVESNADRVGHGYAAWERQLWSSINEPLEFMVRARQPE